MRAGPTRWLLWLALLLPSAVGFALVGVIFGENIAYERWWPIIYPLQGFVTLATPYIVARHLTSRRTRTDVGFPVIHPLAAERDVV